MTDKILNKASNTSKPSDFHWLDASGEYELIELVDDRCHSFWNCQPIGFHKSVKLARERVEEHRGIFA